MENDKAIVIQQRELTPATWEMISRMAPVMHRSRLFGVTSEEAAAAIMLKGFELGLSITASFEFINVIDGKPGLNPRGALALLYNNPAIESVKVHPLMDNGKYLGHECTIKRTNGMEFSAAFTLEDARRAGLVKPGSGWEKYPQNMCQWRAIGFAADVAAPDITSGMTAILKMPEAYHKVIDDDGNLVDEGNVVDVKVNPVSDVPQINLDLLIEKYGVEDVMEAVRVELGGAMPSTPIEYERLEIQLQGSVITLEQLLEQYSAKIILEANGGRMPKTNDEVKAVWKKLEPPF